MREPVGKYGFSRRLKGRMLQTTQMWLKSASGKMIDQKEH